MFSRFDNKRTQFKSQEEIAVEIYGSKPTKLVKERLEHLEHSVITSDNEEELDPITEEIKLPAYNKMLRVYLE